MTGSPGTASKQSDPLTARIRLARETEMDLVRTLFREYEAWLEVDLCFQGFEAELAELPGAYMPPKGGLWLAESGLAGAQDVLGVIALRPQDDEVCELKRLWVRPGYRGCRLGQRLIEVAIDAARSQGYATMRLDTLSDKMGPALELYERLGFVDIPAYYDNPYPHVRFMELALAK